MTCSYVEGGELIHSVPESLGGQPVDKRAAVMARRESTGVARRLMPPAKSRMASSIR